MAVIMTIKLLNNTDIHVISNERNMDYVKSLAIRWSKAFFSNTNLHVKENCIIVMKNISSINTSTHRKRYITAFILNNNCQKLEVEAENVLDAYISVRNKFGISQDLFMLIYELKQIPDKMSALQYCKMLCNNKPELFHYLDKAYEKTNYFVNLSNYSIQLKSVVNLIKDSINGEYKGISHNKIIYLTASLLYFLNSKDLKQDILNGVPNIRIDTFLMIILNEVGKDIDNYNRWVESKGLIAI